MKKIQPVFLRGKRVSLRPAMRRDVPHFLRWVNDPDVRQYIVRNFPLGELEEEKWIDLERKNTDVFLVIIKNDGTPIGAMGLHQINWIDRTAITGALIGEPRYQNKGYGSEAKCLLLEHAFNALDLFKVNSRVIAFNTRSRRHNEKCGYELEGVLKNQVYKNGKRHDELIMSVSREGWQKAKKHVPKRS